MWRRIGEQVGFDWGAAPFDVEQSAGAATGSGYAPAGSAPADRPTADRAKPAPTTAVGLEQRRGRDGQST